VIDTSQLNEAQARAVLTTEGPLLVLAGAGSGKTRVLTYRIAHIVEDLGVPPWEVLAITFTNKAAAEMRERLGALLPGGVRGMWVSTFHAMCVRILRMDAERLGFTSSFVIYDDDDSKRLIKEVYGALQIDPKRFPINAMRSRISAAKNELILPGDYGAAASAAGGKTPGKVTEGVVAKVYALYQDRLKRANAMDFDDLLVNVYLLFKQCPDVLSVYQDRFRYILVDEYQDTNHVQYALVSMMAAGHGNIMVVGDDDQSIYSWRGADIRNILEFERDYEDTCTIKLEENYRSTGHILAAANAVVAHNEHRKEKTLFTRASAGDKVQAYLASDERDEGRWIASEIENLHSRENRSYDDFAVFYRTNAQSRVLEDMFLRAGIRYRIAGGTRFFDRAEIRDVMAYLKLVTNPADDISAKRVINVPRRGIGSTTVERIEGLAHAGRIPFLAACRQAVDDPTFQLRARTALGEFLGILDEGAAYQGDLRDVVEMIVTKSGLVTALEAERTDEAQGRIENIKEFFGVAQEYADSHQDDELDEADPTAAQDGVPALRPDSLEAFMEWVALRSDLDSLGDDTSGSVVMMTVHSAKGLEFPVVFVAGMEEGIFPHMNSASDPKGLEEERRLAYVAITRARERLYLCYAHQRSLYGQTSANAPSRFIAEIPREDMDFAGVGSQGLRGTGYEKRGDRHGTFGSGRGGVASGRVYGQGTGASSARPQSGSRPAPRFDADRASENFAVGDRVDHKTFGRGIVSRVEGDAIYVTFTSGQSKKLLKGFAPIVRL